MYKNKKQELGFLHIPKVHIITIAITLVFVMAALVSSSCTANQRAKEFGGITTLKLQPNRKLINATWKDDNLWYLTRPMHENESPETYEFKEQSSYGTLEGTVIITEVKQEND
ncbi:MAG: hypothetical protein FD167_577 [bacterium]|nr:MAG: hypothetical protein FD167_577 [bacterium]